MLPSGVDSGGENEPHSIQLNSLLNWNLRPLATLLLRQRLQLFFCCLEVLPSSLQGFFTEGDVAFDFGNVLFEFLLELFFVHLEPTSPEFIDWQSPDFCFALMIGLLLSCFQALR